MGSADAPITRTGSAVPLLAATTESLTRVEVNRTGASIKMILKCKRHGDAGLAMHAAQTSRKHTRTFDRNLWVVPFWPVVGHLRVQRQPSVDVYSLHSWRSRRLH